MLALAIFDGCAVVIALLIAIATPPSSQYRAINIVLVGEFLSSAGLAALIDSFLYEGYWPFVIKIIKDLIFVWVFLHVGGTMLSRVQKGILTLHVSMFVSCYAGMSMLFDNYALIMGTLSVIQLLCGVRGALHGAVCGGTITGAWHYLHGRRHP